MSYCTPNTFLNYKKYFEVEIVIGIMRLISFDNLVAQKYYIKRLY